MKLIISSILLCGFSEASRLLHSADEIFCTQDVKLCADGSYVSRTGSNCQFPPCPAAKAGDYCGIPGNDCPQLQCFEADCPDGTCYGCCQECTWEEGSNGELFCSGYIPRERVCPIQQLPIQQLCGGNGLLECDADYTCQPNPNCPKDMFDCPGICVKNTPSTTRIEPIQQRCGGNGLLDCADGYKCIANPSCPKDMFDCPGICVKDTQPLTLLTTVKPICGGFNNCAVYYDGCNDCTCDADDGEEICPDMICKRLEEPKCIQCEDGYVLNEKKGKCEICQDESNRVSCKILDDCDIDNGYQCKPDPLCLNKKILSLNCANKKVCLNVSGQCMFHANCQRDHKCMLINGKNGFCVKYQ